MTDLQLKVIDKEDLKILSACVQDAVFSLKECAYAIEQKKFICCVERFCWEKLSEDKKADYCWSQSILEFHNVSSIKMLEIDKNDHEKYYPILSLYYEENYLYIHLVGGAVIALAIEPLEIYLKDLARKRMVKNKPNHSEAL